MDKNKLIVDLATAEKCLKLVVAKRLEENSEDSEEEVKVPKDYWRDPYIQEKLGEAAQLVLLAQLTVGDLMEGEHDFPIEECVSSIAAWIIRKGLADVQELREHHAKAQAEIERLKCLLEEPGLPGGVPEREVPIGFTGEGVGARKRDWHIREGEPFYEVKHVGTDEEVRAGKAAGTLLAQWMRRDRAVQRFRREVLHGRLFPDNVQGHEAAWRFITSPLPQVLTVKDYEVRGLCPATTQGRLLPGPSKPAPYKWYSGLLGQAESWKRDQAGRSIVVFVVEIDGPGRSTQRIRVPHWAQSYSYIGLEDGNIAMPLTPSWQHRGRRSEEGPCATPWFGSSPGKDERNLEGCGESVVKQAMKLCSDWLVNSPVDIWQIFTFLLTDAVPNTIPIRTLASSYDYHLLYEDKSFEGGLWAEGGITLHVQPWVQPESLARHWRDIRGTRKHLPKEDALELFTFALDNTEPNKDFSWQALADQWEAEKGKKLSRDSFRKAVLGTREALFPKFRFPAGDEV